MVGVPFSGKSTLFTALTRTGAVGGRANQAVVPVPDSRLPVLAELERSAKIVPAQVRFVDVPGGTSAQGLAALRATDALCVVLRSFGTDADPMKELAEVRADVLLADLAVADNALENARRRLKGRGGQVEEEVRALERAHAGLSSETLLRDAGLEEAETKILRGLSLLTLKPWVLVANLEEGSLDLLIVERNVPTIMRSLPLLGSSATREAGPSPAKFRPRAALGIAPSRRLRRKVRGGRTP